MNIKKIGLVAMSVSIFLTAAQPALALDFSKLEVKLSDKINMDCLSVEGHDPVWGCFKNEFVFWPGHPDLRPVPTIYIHKDVPAALLPYVLLYNLEQYLTISYSDEEMAKVFDPVPTTDMHTAIRKDAANSFAFWVLGGTITPAKQDFFRAALLK